MGGGRNGNAFNIIPRYLFADNRPVLLCFGIINTVDLILEHEN